MFVKKYHKSLLSGLLLSGLMVVLGLAQVGGCVGPNTTTSTEPAPPGNNPPPPHHDYDGYWSGTTYQGENVYLHVVDDKLVYFSLAYSSGTLCSDYNRWGIRADALGELTEQDTFLFTENSSESCESRIYTFTLSVNGTFDSTINTHVSGGIDLRGTCCDGQVVGGWDATKDTSVFTDDAFEDNDIYSEAYVISYSIDSTVIYSDPPRQCYDNDWYILKNVPIDRMLIAEIFFDETDLDLGGSIYETFQTTGTPSYLDHRSAGYLTGTIGTKRVAVKTTDATDPLDNNDYYFEVFRLFGKGGPYRMKVSVNTDDTLEDNDSFTTAVTLFPGTTTLKLYDDADWFKISAGAGQTLTATASIAAHNESGYSRINVMLYDEPVIITTPLDSDYLTTSIVSGTGKLSATVNYTNGAAAKDYYLQLTENNITTNSNIVPSQTYDLAVTLAP